MRRQIGGCCRYGCPAAPARGHIGVISSRRGTEIPVLHRWKCQDRGIDRRIGNCVDGCIGVGQIISHRTPYQGRSNPVVAPTPAAITPTAAPAALTPAHTAPSRITAPSLSAPSRTAMPPAPTSSPSAAMAAAPVPPFSVSRGDGQDGKEYKYYFFHGRSPKRVLIAATTPAKKFAPHPRAAHLGHEM